MSTLSHVKIKNGLWFAKGALATLFVGAVASCAGDFDIYDEVRVRSVSPIASIFGESAKSISRWLPKALWYDRYAVVNTEFSNVRLVETTAAPVVGRLGQTSCVMLRDTSKIDPSWVKVEQIVDGKRIQGYMQTDALTMEDGYIGKPCKAMVFGK